MAVIAMMGTSCATINFKPVATVDLELRFNTWESVCITKPDTRENGFIPVLTGPETLQAIQHLEISRRFAAIVVGNSYDAAQARNIGAQWFQQLAVLGFERVIVLRGSDAFPIARLPIVYDSAISSGDDKKSRRRYSHAPTSSAARTDAAHSSIVTVR